MEPGGVSAWFMRSLCNGALGVFSFEDEDDLTVPRWRPRQREHFVARPLSRKRAQGRKFLQPCDERKRVRVWER